MTITVTASMTTIPYSSVDTAGRKDSGILKIKVDKFALGQCDLNENVMQAVNNAAARMDLKAGEELTAEQIAQLSIHAATQLYVAATSSLASFYEMAKNVFINQWYLGTPGVSLDEDDVKRLSDLRDSHFPLYLKECWKLWVDAVCVEIKVSGFAGNLYALKSDLLHKLPGLLSLPMGTVEIKVIKTGERSATVEANGVKIDVADLYGEKIPVMQDIVKIARELEPGAEKTVTKEIGPDYMVQNSKLIRELGAAAAHADTETAPKLTAIAAVATTYGIRNVMADKTDAPAEHKARMERAVTTVGEIVLTLYPPSDWHETWAVAQLNPHFAMVIDDQRT